MATLTLTTTTDQDSAIKYACDRWNAQSKEAAITPAQFAKDRISHYLDGWVQRWQRETEATSGEAYQKAAAAAAAGDTTAASDVATMDAILAKYQ